MPSRPLPRPPLASALLAVLAAISVALHLVVLAVTHFGVHRDEFLYFSMGRHLRFWRMDFPPAIALLANLSRAIFGDSLAAVRVFPALEGAVLIVLAGLLARELGGRRFAQGLAAVAVFASPVFLRAGTVFQPVVLDDIWWTLSLLALARIGRLTADNGMHSADAARWWLVLGLAMGAGLLTKFSILFFAAAVLAALLITSDRRWLATRWPWLAAAVALVLGSPSLAGQIALHFPVVGQMRDLTRTQLVHVSTMRFAAEQMLLVGPIALVIAAIGLAALIAWPPLRPFRVLGWSCLLVFALLMALHGKSYYAAPIYPALFAAGAVVLEHAPAARWARLAPALRWATVAAVVLLGVVGLPVAVPLLSRTATADYTVRIGATSALRTDRGRFDRLPQDYADMLGWRRQARTLSRVYHALPAVEQGEAVIIAGNYGEAGSAEFYGRRDALPPVVSTAGSFWFFGPGSRPGAVAITIGLRRDEIAPYYASVTRAATVRSPWSVRYERVLPVYVARGPRGTLQRAWVNFR